MSLDRPGAGGDERDDEFTEVLDACPREPRRAAQLPQQDTTGEASYVAGPGQRRAGPGFSSVRAVVRLRTAGGHGRACCRLKGHDGQNGTRVASRPGIAGQRISPAGRRAAGKPLRR